MSDSSPTQADATAFSFEQALLDLERIVEQLETGRLTLDEALGRYETALARIRRCQLLLSAAEQKVSQLLGVDENGVARTAPFDAEMAPLEERTARRG